MTRLEVMIAASVFVIGALETTAIFGLFNAQAAHNRVDSAAQAILRAKVNNVLADPWDRTTPVGCVVTSGAVPDTADPNDPFDVGPTVNLLTGRANPAVAVATGVITRNTRAQEASAGVATVVVDYTLTYQFAGKTYVATASTARSRDR